MIGTLDEMEYVKKHALADMAVSAQSPRSQPCQSVRPLHRVKGTLRRGFAPPLTRLQGGPAVATSITLRVTFFCEATGPAKMIVAH